MRARKSLWLPALLLVAAALTTASTQAAQYDVDGFVLGAQVDRGSPNYLSYECKPSDEFADAVTCGRQQQKGAAGKALLSSALIHAQDGTALYAMVNVAPVTLSQSAVKSEIKALSQKIGAQPSEVIWFPEDSDEPDSVIAIWGSVRLEELVYESSDAVSEGENPRVGILVDTRGDPAFSAKESLPLYRLVGGPGYVYSASFGGAEKGHRRYIVVNASELAVRQFQRSLAALLEKDRSLASDDYSLWPDVAVLTRNLARDTSPETANETVDMVFTELQSTKLQSHVWSIVPLGTIQRLREDMYWRHATYGPRTKHPKIRRDAEKLLAKEPNEPFIEFAHFVVGDFDGALKANPNSIISDVLHYASGHRIIQSLTQEAFEFAKTRMTPKTPALARYDLQSLLESDPDDLDEGLGHEVDLYISFINQNPDIFDRKPLGDIFTNFASRAAEARQHFEFVLQHPSSPHADDAAYMIGWLEQQQGNQADALAFYSRALEVGHDANNKDEDENEDESENDEDPYRENSYEDYRPAALKQVVRLLERISPQEQLTTVGTSNVFDKEPSLWYVAARSAYRDFDYALAMDIVERALKAINIPIEAIPVTTDPEPISEALKDIDSELTWDANLRELPYLIEASRELSRYEVALREFDPENPDDFVKKARSIITKYSMLLDPEEESDEADAPREDALREVEHKDLRQALHLIDMTLERTPREPKFSQLREWLHYRKVRILAVYAPKRVPEAISEMQQEFPTSELLNNAFAEQIFAQGIMLGDVEAARRTFDELLAKYPNGNGVDNAYSWMAIMLRCAGHREEAKKINKEIILRFPLTRHAKYALERLADPNRSVGWDSGCGSLDTENP